MFETVDCYMYVCMLSVTAGEVALNSLQDVVDVLEDSIQYSESVASSAQTTPRSNPSILTG